MMFSFAVFVAPLTWCSQHQSGLEEYDLSTTIAHFMHAFKLNFRAIDLGYIHLQIHKSIFRSIRAHIGFPTCALGTTLASGTRNTYSYNNLFVMAALLPIDANLGILSLFVILHDNLVGAITQVEVCLVLGGRLDNPCIDDELVVYIDTHTVIGNRIEAIGAALKVLHLLPTHTKAVLVQIAKGATREPIEVDLQVLSF
jgi:hypothetical protein